MRPAPPEAGVEVVQGAPVELLRLLVAPVGPLALAVALEAPLGPDPCSLEEVVLVLHHERVELALKRWWIVVCLRRGSVFFFATAVPFGSRS